MTLYDSDFVLALAGLLGLAALLGLALVMSRTRPDLRGPWEL